jgi:hypothetical protein
MNSTKISQVKIRIFAVLSSIGIFAGIVSCDMSLIAPPLPPAGTAPLGHSLTLLNLPRNTQTTNISLVYAANAASRIAKLDPSKPIAITQGVTNSSATIPLVYTSGKEFIEEGPLYVSFSLNIDALTQIIVKDSDKIIVNFTNGSGFLDIEKLVLNHPELINASGDGSASGDGYINAQEKEAIEREGHYLKLIHLPRNIQARNISTAYVANAASRIAKLDPSGTVKIFQEATSSSAYIPLVYTNGTEFIEDGLFYVTFTLNIDAVIQIMVKDSDKILVEFVQGRGELDILTLPAGTVSGSDNSGTDGTIGGLNPGGGSGSGSSGNPSGGGSSGDGYISEQEKETLEREGHYLKLTHLPSNTQATNITAVYAANSVSQIAKLDTKTKIQIYKELSSCTAYIPLVYTSGMEFVEYGPLYVIFTVNIDAFTRIVVTQSDKIAVEFYDGRAELDIETLVKTNPGVVQPGDGSGGSSGSGSGPGSTGDGSDGSSGSGSGSGSGTGSTGDNPGAIIDMEQNGHFLKLYHLPAGTARENISAVRVTDGVRQVARIDSSNSILIDSETAYSNVYIPLLSSSTGNPFTRSGSFYVEFIVQIDALTKISVKQEHYVLVQFSEGQGQLDIGKLLLSTPGIVDAKDDPSQIAEERLIEDIISSGGYIRFYNLPRNISKNKFSSVSAATLSNTIARCADYDAIAIRQNTLTAEAYVPLVNTNGTSFTESGSYYTLFSISIDALTQITAGKNNPVLYTYSDGRAEVNVMNIPPPEVPPPTAPHNLTIIGLPTTASPSNFADVLVNNSEGVVAKCPDYTQISITSYAGQAAAIIPLVYDNNRAFNGQAFSDSGSFIVTFSFFSDALENLVVEQKNNCIISFSNGSGVVDADNVPSVPHNYLTITNLPANLQALNITDVFIWNQAGKVAQCEDYGKTVILNTSVTATLKIPLVYKSDTAHIFEETGSYFVSFDLNIDALTRITITEDQKLLVSFSSGNGSLNASTLPQTLPVPYLTIIGLPVNTVKSNFSNVFLYNAAGQIAKCSSYQDIIITANSNSASAMIPLVYYNDPTSYFRDSGQFIVTYTINVDVNTVISKTLADAQVAAFTNGSGSVNLSSDYGYFSGGLVNPTDTSSLVIKKGTVFEMNGAYIQIKANTAVDPISIQKTAPVYIYAVQNAGGVTFEYSTTAPTYSSAKHGYYDGTKRALYKCVFINDTIDKFVAKTFIDDNWTHFDHYTVDNYALGGNSQVSALSGSGNPAATTVTLQPGGYVFILSGAGGGGGGGIDGSGSYDRTGGVGGKGGFISELVILTQTTTFTIYTGQGGNGSDYISYGNFQGAGAGGGGSGTFVYSSQGYLLCAGGGGGGGGGGANDGGGGGGGAGGAISSGGKGGKGGDDREYDWGWKTYTGSAGGSGGGSVYSLTSIATSSGFAGSGSPGDDEGENGGNGTATATSSYNAPQDWMNTNGANGQGGNGSTYGNGTLGGTGGNNRNSTRSGGASGGAAGQASDGSGSAGAKGGDGSILMLKVF